MIEIKVHQIKKDAKDRDFKIFRNYDWVVREMGKIDFNDYYVVWEADIPDDMTLDDIFEMCNCCVLEDYKGHSMSVSDIVEMDGTCWYCDAYGWKAL